MPVVQTAFDERHMRRALELARRHRPHPNPHVGSVVVGADGVVIGEGAHRGPGEDHAEVVALSAAEDGTAGATVYVTLEPCTHHGRTPPCVEALISAGVARVVIGARDPDSRVAGSGVRKLREAGVEVVEECLSVDSRAVDPAYFHHRETGLPLVTLKYAMTLDGSAAAADRTSRWITSEAAREDAHRLRASSDAVVVGAGTVGADDPRLDVRIPGRDGSQPRPVVIAGAGDLPEDAQLWERDPIVVMTSERRLPGGEAVIVAGKDGRPDPVAACGALADLGYLDILFEGGPTVAGAWWKAGVITRGVVYVGARLGGGAGIPPLGRVFGTIDEAVEATITQTRSLGPDLRIDFEQA